MTRGLPMHDQSRSFVHWPTDMENTGEGGMAVFLIVPERSAIDWAECSMNMPILRAQDVVVQGQRPIEEQVWGVSQYSGMEPESRAELYKRSDLLACVCLGTTGGSYSDPDWGYFIAGFSDLTDDGQQLYQLLARLYKVEPVLITFLDT